MANPQWFLGKKSLANLMRPNRERWKLKASRP